MKFMRGEVPASALKDHVFTWLHLLNSDQRENIEGKVGKVRPSNCSVHNPDEPLCALWDGHIPIGLTAAFHLSMFAHPDSRVNFIDCSNPVAFNELFTSLPQKQLTDEAPEDKRAKK